MLFVETKNATISNTKSKQAGKRKLGEGKTRPYEFEATKPVVFTSREEEDFWDKTKTEKS